MKDRYTFFQPFFCSQPIFANFQTICNILLQICSSFARFLIQFHSNIAGEFAQALLRFRSSITPNSLELCSNFAVGLLQFYTSFLHSVSLYRVGMYLHHQKQIGLTYLSKYTYTIKSLKISVVS